MLHVEHRSVRALTLKVTLFQGDSTVVGTSKLRDLYERFEEELVRRQERAKATRPTWEPPKTKLDEDPGGCWKTSVARIVPNLQLYAAFPKNAAGIHT